MMANVAMMMRRRRQGARREEGEELQAAAARRGEKGEDENPPRTVAQARPQRKCLECHFHVAAIHDNVTQ